MLACAVLGVFLALPGCTKKRISTDPPPRRPEAQVRNTPAATDRQVRDERMDDGIIEETVLVEELDQEPLPGQAAARTAEASADTAGPQGQQDQSVAATAQQPDPAAGETVPVEPDAERTSALPASFDQTGLASWIADENAGLPTAGGELYEPEDLTAAHRTYPLGTRLTVINLENGRMVTVRVNDRGPFKQERIIDVSRAAAEKLGMVQAGVVRVGLRVEDGAATPEATDTATEPEAPTDTGAASTEAASAEASAQAAGDGLYYVQVGAYSTRDGAEQVLDKLVRAGYGQSRIVAVQGEGVFRVQAGGFPDGAEARSALSFLREEYPDSFVVTP